MTTPRDGKLLTVAQAKMYLQLDEDAEDWDELVADLIEEAEANLESYIGNRLVSETETMYFSGGVTAFHLPYWPIETGSVTVVDTQGTVTTTDDETYDTQYYRVDEDLSIIRRTSSIGSRKFWGSGVDRWKITWTGGLDQHRDWSRIQLELRGSVRDVMADVFLNANPAAMKESEGGGLSKDVRLAGIPARVTAVWDRYRGIF